TGECFAEVTYQTQRGQYRSHWGQHRARRRADGELQPARHEIVDVHTGKVLETGIMEVARKTESVTGMDFGRFTRSMLLAQGGFAAFLEASPGERAPILEQITGTDIYSRISMAVHERRALEQQQLAILQAGMQTTSLLDEESLAHVQEDLAQRSGQMALLGNHLQRLEEQRAWLRRLDTLKHEVDGLQEEAGALENEWQNATALRARYADATRAAVLEPLHVQLSTLRSQQQADQTRLQHHAAEHQQSRQQTESFNETLAQAQRQHVQVQQARSRALPVIRRARSLDQQMQRARQALDHENERFAERVRARDQHRAELDKRILSHESQARQLTAARAYLDRHAHDA